MAFQLVVVIIGLLVGWARKGSVWSLTNLKIKWIWLLPICYILQVESIAHLKGVPYETMVVASYVGLIVFGLMNLRTTGLIWALLGTCANFIVMLANGLRMPAYLPVVRKVNPGIIPELQRGDIGKSIAMTSHTHLNFLGDIFTFNFQTITLISVGDILFAIGLVLFIQYAMTLNRGEPVDGSKELA